MTAIAWAIMTLGMIFYSDIYYDRLKETGVDKFVGGFTTCCIIILIVSTLREWSR